MWYDLCAVSHANSDLTIFFTSYQLLLSYTMNLKYKDTLSKSMPSTRPQNFIVYTTITYISSTFFLCANTSHEKAKQIVSFVFYLHKRSQ